MDAFTVVLITAGVACAFLVGVLTGLFLARPR